MLHFGFPVGWRNASLCFAILHYNSSSHASVREQANAAAREFCELVPFESMIWHGDKIREEDIANYNVQCSPGEHLPTRRPKTSAQKRT